MTINEPAQTIDYIDFFPNRQSRILDQALPLFEKGHTFTEISNITGIPEATIRQKIQKHLGSSEYTTAMEKRRKRALPSQAPYGFAKVGGQLLRDPREWHIVELMARLYKSGQSFNTIAKTLNEKAIPTRKAAVGRHDMVKKIIFRNLHSKQLKNGSPRRAI